MNAALKQGLVTLAVIVIALVAYDIFKRSEVRAAKEQAQMLKEQAAALQKQADALKQQTDAMNEHANALYAEATAMKDEVAAEHTAAELEQQRYLLKSYRMEGLAAAQSVKVAIAEVFTSTGKLPASNKEAGVAEPEQFNGQALQSLQVGRAGIITLAYNEKSGVRDGRILLIPDISNTTVVIKWRCESPDFKDIAVSMAQCEYAPYAQ